MRNTGNFHGEVVNVDKYGNKFISLLSASMLYSKHGEYLGTVGISRDVTRQKEINLALVKRNSILQAVSYAADKFLNANSWKDDIEDILAEIGKATNVSRVYLFENSTKDNEILSSQLYKWCTSKLSCNGDNTSLQNFSFVANGLDRWLKNLNGGKFIVGLTKNFPKKERDILKTKNILSILIMPIMVDDLLWGFIGFDDCFCEREWSDIEIDAFKTVANTLAAGIRRAVHTEIEERMELARWIKAEENATLKMTRRENDIMHRESKQALFKALTLMENNDVL